MKTVTRIYQPINIHLGKNYNCILADDCCKKEYPLNPGAILGGEHYGFVLITDTKGSQKENIYSTQYPIDAINMEGNTLKIFEKGRKESWLFDEKGFLKHSPYEELSEEELVIVYSDPSPEVPNNEPKFINPIEIKIAMDPKKSTACFEKDSISYPLCPGVMIGDEHYGFILTIETSKGEKKFYYPTQNRIDALGSNEEKDDLKIYEEGKQYPWIFNHKGKLKTKASCKKYNIPEETSNGFVLQKK